MRFWQPDGGMAGQRGGVLVAKRRTFPLFLGMVTSGAVVSAVCGVLGVAASGVLVRGWWCGCCVKGGRRFL
jgi:hypothetical protein